MKEHVLKELLKTIVLGILRKPAMSHHYKSLHFPQLSSTVPPLQVLRCMEMHIFSFSVK